MKIENEIYWTDGWNPVKLISGGYYCDPVSPGCHRCWGNDINLRFYKGTKFGTLTHPEFVLDEKVLEQPLHWRKPRVIAVQWLGDLFHKDIPWNDQYKVFDMMLNAPQHQYLILTKRPEIMVKHLKDITFHLGRNYYPYVCLDHLWLGTTICNQQEADENVVKLLQIPGKHWLSVEPCLEDIDLNIPYGQGVGELALESGKIHQVILGGESGHGARPMCPDWPRRVRDDCAEAGVPFFFKQWGEWITPSGDFMEIGGDTGEPERYSSIHHWSLSPRDSEPIAYRVGKKKAGRLLDGK